MQPCKYAKWTKCEKCDIPFHNQCKKFLKIHAMWLMRDILKDKSEAFKYTPVKGVEFYNVVYSRKPDVAKSVALQFALQKNVEISYYTSNVAMDMVSKKVDIEDKMVYLYVKKAAGDDDKIIGMIESFCDWVVKNNGGKVSIYIDKYCPYELKYKKVVDEEGETNKEEVVEDIETQGESVSEEGEIKDEKGVKKGETKEKPKNTKGVAKTPSGNVLNQRKLKTPKI